MLPTWRDLDALQSSNAGEMGTWISNLFSLMDFLCRKCKMYGNPRDKKKSERCLRGASSDSK